MVVQAQPQGVGASVPQRGANVLSNNTQNNTAAGSPQCQTSSSSTPLPGQVQSLPARSQVQGNVPNGHLNGIAMGMQGLPQAQMQINMPAQQQLTPVQQQQMRILMQQRAIAQNNAQFQMNSQQLNQPGNLAAAHLAGTNNIGLSTPGMMMPLGGPKMNGNPQGMNNMNVGSSASRSSHSGVGHTNGGRPLSSGVVPTINQFQARIQQQHPDWPLERVAELAQKQLGTLVQQRQNAMNAASGNIYQANSGMMTGASSPPNAGQQSYNTPHFRPPSIMQRGSTSQDGSPNLGAARPPSRSATPQNPQQLQSSPGLGQAHLTRAN
jgi:chromatin modification-related protein VID21